MSESTKPEVRIEIEDLRPGSGSLGRAATFLSRELFEWRVFRGEVKIGSGKAATRAGAAKASQAFSDRWWANLDYVYRPRTAPRSRVRTARFADRSERWLDPK